jgi:RNA polymerase sigma-70 factor (sigma-E family)
MGHATHSFDVFVAEHGASLLRTAHLITLDRTEAEDLVQECLLRLSQRWDRVGAMEHRLAYARRVLTNLAFRDSKRRRRRLAELREEVRDVAEPIDALELAGVRRELLDALRQLTVRQRTVLALRYFHDFSESQVADLLGCSVGTVRGTTSRSLAQLRCVIPREPSRPGEPNDRAA